MEGESRPLSGDKSLPRAESPDEHSAKPAEERQEEPPEKSNVPAISEKQSEKGSHVDPAENIDPAEKKEEEEQPPAEG